MNHNNVKKLTNLEMGNIEFYLSEGMSPAEIGKKLNRDPSGIRKEIKKYKSYVGIARKCSNCLNKDNCKSHYLCDKIIDRVKCSSCKYCDFAVKNCPYYETIVDCDLLKKNHHVCNSCDIEKKCKKVKIKYNAEMAIKKHNIVLNVSRKDLKFDIFPQEFKDYLSDRVRNGISPDIIVNTLPDRFKMYKICAGTLYEYIDKGLLDCCNLDLRNKVSRIRYGSNTEKRNTIKGHHLNGRSIENLSILEKDERPLGICEFDTVEGIKGGELLFTIMIPVFSLMLGFKITNKTQEEIIKVLDKLEDILDSYFYVMFNKAIPDNGPEFLDFEGIETSVNPEYKRLSVYYTHTYSSYEKPHIENNHILLRWLIRKKYDITLLSADDILDIINRLNNYPRPIKGYKTPLQLLENELGDYILDLLNLHHIPIEELNMKDMITPERKKRDILSGRPN